MNQMYCIHLHILSYFDSYILYIKSTIECCYSELKYNIYENCTNTNTNNWPATHLNGWEAEGRFVGALDWDVFIKVPSYFKVSVFLVLSVKNNGFRLKFSDIRIGATPMGGWSFDAEFREKLYVIAVSLFYAIFIGASHISFIYRI